MLRLKQVMDELKIPQKRLVTATGLSKTQISLTLNSGRLPVNEDKFKDGAASLVRDTPEIIEWLAERSMNVERLFESLAVAADETKSLSLDKALWEVVGRAVLIQPEPEETIIALARIAGHLMGEIRHLAGHEAPYVARLETQVCGWLMGATTTGRG